MKRIATERKVADTLLQAPLEICLGGTVYEAPAPTYGTMVEISAIIAENDKVLEVDAEDITPGVLRYAKDSTYLIDIMVTLILGAKRLKSGGGNFFFNLAFKVKHRTLKSPKRWLFERLMTSCTNTELAHALGTLLGALNVRDFFACITFLREANITRPTKVMQATQSGPQS